VNVRNVLIVLNIVGLGALAAYLAWAALSPRRARSEGERTPANRTPFLEDEDLEGRRLERVLGWSLLFAGIVAVALPLYWLREPTRQDESIDYFDEGAVERGETLFANATMTEAYDAVLSLQCANCHGNDGGGGTRPQVIDRDGPDGPQPPQTYDWKVPALNTVLLRFSEEEVERIITYGRPGTPMQAFGVAGGGAENEQTIEDIVAYLRSIQLSPEEAKQQAEEELRAAQAQAEDQLETAREALTGAEEELQAAADALREVLGTSGDETALLGDCEEIEIALDEDPESVSREERSACRTFVDAVEARDEAQKRLDWAQQWVELRRGVSDGQLLFELFCARCHTEGWSVFDPADPDTLVVLGEPGGGGGQGGGIGFNLRDGAPIRRFGEGDAGVESQVEFVTDGSDENVPYGRAGIGSGRMPGFGNMLTRDQIEKIVEYERDGLDTTRYSPEEE